MGRDCGKSLPHSCGTQGALRLFEEEDGSYNGYCFACRTYVPDVSKFLDEDYKPTKNSNPKLTQEEIDNLLEEISTYRTVSVTSRKLSDTSLKAFGAKTSLSEFDGKSPTAIYWPITTDTKLTGYLVTTINKPGQGSNFFIGNVKGCDLLNWANAISSGSQRLIITEGPKDMASVEGLYNKFLSEDKKHYKPAITSLPMGSGSVTKVLSKHYKDIKNNFKEVIFVFDNDEPGRLAVTEGLKIIPYAKSVTLPYKDVNDCLLNNSARVAYNKISFEAKVPKNTNLIYASSLHDVGKEPAKWGEFKLPWDKINQATRNFREGETVYIGAGVKIGKGEVRNSIISEMIKQGHKCVVSSYEEPKLSCYKRVLGKMVGTTFIDPKVPFNEKLYDEAGKLVGDNLLILDKYQTADLDSTYSDMRYAASLGFKVHFIDPITNFTNGLSSSETNTVLQGMSQSISEIAGDLGLLVFLFCHLNSPEGSIKQETREELYKKGKFLSLGNCSHEKGGNVESYQFAGSRGMMRSCNFMIGLEGNKDDELPTNVRNFRKLKLLENREFGETTSVLLEWDPVTTLFREVK